MRMLLFLLGCFTGCGADIEPIPLTEEFYNWECVERSQDYPVDQVIVSTETCDEDVIWLVSELHYVTGQFMKQRLYKDLASCHWEVSYPLVGAECDLVDGVTLTAWVEPASWSEIEFGGSDD